MQLCLSLVLLSTVVTLIHSQAADPKPDIQPLFRPTSQKFKPPPPPPPSGSSQSPIEIWKALNDMNHRSKSAYFRRPEPIQHPPVITRKPQPPSPPTRTTTPSSVSFSRTTTEPPEPLDPVDPVDPVDAGQAGARTHVPTTVSPRYTKAPRYTTTTTEEPPEMEDILTARLVQQLFRQTQQQNQLQQQRLRQQQQQQQRLKERLQQQQMQRRKALSDRLNRLSNPLVMSYLNLFDMEEEGLEALLQGLDLAGRTMSGASSMEESRSRSSRRFKSPRWSGNVNNHRNPFNHNNLRHSSIFAMSSDSDDDYSLPVMSSTFRPITTTLSPPPSPVINDAMCFCSPLTSCPAGSIQNGGTCDSFVSVFSNVQFKKCCYQPKYSRHL